MLISMLIKDLKLIFRNKSNVLYIVFVPVLLILIMGFTMKNYMSSDFNTFDDGIVLYVNDGASADMLKKFGEISSQITEKTGVEFNETDDFSAAKKDVESSKAFGAVRITENKFDYFRSSFNETEGGEIVRSLFTELSQSDLKSTVAVTNTVLDIKRPDSSVYYTFSGLSLAILLMGAVIAGSYSKDRTADVFDRISLSTAGRKTMILSKLCSGIVCGAIQILLALVVSTLVFDIKWEYNLGLIILVYFVLVIFASSLGSLVGVVFKNSVVSISIVEIVAMLSGYLGGSITPVYLLEGMPIIKYLVKISPVYRTSQSLSNLYNDIVDEKTYKCIAVLMVLSAVLILLTSVLSLKAGEGKKIVKDMKDKERTEV
jgi:ABC-2 type transport system permease protein